jgi:hypothetical protein
MNQTGIIVMKSGYMDMIPMTLNALDNTVSCRNYDNIRWCPC